MSSKNRARRLKYALDSRRLDVRILESKVKELEGKLADANTVIASRNETINRLENLLKVTGDNYGTGTDCGTGGRT